MDKIEFKSRTGINIDMVDDNPKSRGLNRDQTWFEKRLTINDFEKKFPELKNFHSEIYGNFEQVNQCSVKSISGERCPEAGTVKIKGTDDWICNSCFKEFENKYEVKEIKSDPKSFIVIM